MKKPNLTVLTHANTLTPRIFFIANLKEDLSDWPTLGWAFWSMLREYPHAMMPSSTIGTGVQMIQSELVFLSISAVMWCDTMWWSNDLLFNLRQALPQWWPDWQLFYAYCITLIVWTIPEEGAVFIPHLQVIEAIVVLLSEEKFKVLQMLLYLLGDITAAVKENQMIPPTLLLTQHPEDREFFSKGNAMKSHFGQTRLERLEWKPNCDSMAHSIAECKEAFRGI